MAIRRLAGETGHLFRQKMKRLGSAHKATGTLTQLCMRVGNQSLRAAFIVQPTWGAPALVTQQGRSDHTFTSLASIYQALRYAAWGTNWGHCVPTALKECTVPAGRRKQKSQPHPQEEVASPSRVLQDPGTKLGEDLQGRRHLNRPRTPWHRPTKAAPEGIARLASHRDPDL